jgi:hypothetical protein
MPASWGPSLFDIATAWINQKQDHWTAADKADLSDSDDSLSEEGSEYDGKDAEFMDWAEEVMMVDAEQRDSLSEVRNEIDTYIGRKRHRLD